MEKQKNSRKNVFDLFDAATRAEPRYWSAGKIVKEIQAKRASAREVCADVLKQVSEVEPEIRAWECIDPEAVLGEATRIDRKNESGKISRLAGVPFGVKDVFNTRDLPTTMGSDLWRGFTPGNDARVIYDIRREDGVVLGKTVTAEFAVHYLPSGKTKNPHDLGYIPGTSSSGSAAAVATFMAPLALGTQTAGSIIRPASYCGVMGFKPTFGAIPRTGVLKTTDTLDTIGCLARTVDDLELCFEVIRVHGRDYPITHERLVPGPFPKELKISFLLEGPQIVRNFEAYARDALLGLVSTLAKTRKDWRFEPLQFISELDEIHPLHSTIYDKTLSYYFQQEAAQFDQISDIMKELIARGSGISSKIYLNAIKRQAEIRESVTRALEDVDLVITLSTAGEAPLIGVDEKPDTCLIWTFMGFPTLSLPLFKGPNRLPFGLQIVGKRYDDYKVLEFARRLLVDLGLGTL